LIIMNADFEERPVTCQSLYPPTPWDPANAPELVRKKRVYAENDTWVNLDAISELSEEPVFVRVLKTGIVTSIYGNFRGGSPLEIFWRILEVGGLEPRPEEWTIVDERPYDDERFSMLIVQRHNSQGLPLGGGIVALIFDPEGLYAINGRLAGPLPEVDTGPVTREELQERNPEFIVEGPFLYVPDVMWFPHIELPPEPMVMYALFGPESAMYIDSYGNIPFSCDPPPDTPEIIMDFYRRHIYVQEYYLLPCLQRALLITWIDFAYLLSKTYFDPNGPYSTEIVVYGGKGEAPRNLLGWSTSWWDTFYKALTSINLGCGSKYVREPKVVYSSKGDEGYEKDAALDIWFEHLAVMLNFEASCNPAWEIKNLSTEGRSTLWDMSKTYDKHVMFNEGVYVYDEKLLGWGASYRPYAEFLLLQQMRVIDTTSADKTVENLSQYVRTYFKHADSRLSEAVKVWGREFNAEHVLVFAYRDTQDGFHVTRGCHHTSALMCSLLRQVNIPCMNQIIELQPKAEHSRILFVESQKTVFHSDDFYLGIGIMQVNHQELIPGLHNAPGNQQFAVPIKDLLVDEQVVKNMFYKTFTQECNGVTTRTNGGKTTAPGCKTPDEARTAEYRRYSNLYKSWVWLSWLDLYFLFQRTFDDFLIRNEPDAHWPYLKPGNSTNYSEDFTLEQREKIICEAFNVVSTHGLNTLLNKCTYLGNTSVSKDVTAGKPHNLKPPPGCPHSIP
jgi:hypothetical protein